MFKEGFTDEQKKFTMHNTEIRWTIHFYTINLVNNAFSNILGQFYKMNIFFHAFTRLIFRQEK